MLSPPLSNHISSDERITRVHVILVVHNREQENMIKDVDEDVRQHVRVFLIYQSLRHFIDNHHEKRSSLNVERLMVLYTVLFENNL